MDRVSACLVPNSTTLTQTRLDRTRPDSLQTCRDLHRPNGQDSCRNVRSNFFSVRAEKYSVWAHIFMPEHLNFIIDAMSPKTTTKSLLFETARCVVLHAVPAYCLSFDTRLISLDRHQVSTLQRKVPSPAAWFPSNGHHANHRAAVGNCCAAFSSSHARPRSLEGTLLCRSLVGPA